MNVAVTMKKNNIIQNEYELKLNKFKYLIQKLDESGIQLKNLNNVNFICSLSLISPGREMNKRKTDQTKDIIFSSKLFLGILDPNTIQFYIERNRNLFYYSRYDKIHVIFISLDIDLNSNKENYIRTIEKSESSGLITFDFYSYRSFMKNIHTILSKNNQENQEGVQLGPIFIFQGLHLSNIISIFKEFGFTLHGGSTSLRHKLSSLETELAIFLYLTNLVGLDKKQDYYQYVDSFLSNNKVDNTVYNYYNYNIHFTDN